jgi:hypothetical protein
MFWKWWTTPYLLIPAHCMARKEMKARPRVTLRLPVAVDENGVSPSRAATRMKKKKLRSSGTYLRPSWPMFFSAISSRT